MDTNRFFELLRSFTQLTSLQLERAQEHLRYHMQQDLLLQVLTERQTGRCSLYVLGLIYTCSKFAGLRCPLWIPTVFLNCFAPLPN